MATFSKVDILTWTKIISFDCKLTFLPRDNLSGLSGGILAGKGRVFCSPGVIVSNLLEFILPVGSPIEGLLP